jgi:predicted dehydrogenase
MSGAGKKLGVAVVGLGVGEQHARAYVETGRCDLRYVYDLDGERARRVGEELGAKRVAESYEQIVDDAKVELISIASFDDAHYGQVIPALEAGKHVFVEKPLCRTMHELRAVKRSWQAHRGRVKLSSNLVLRGAPLYEWLKSRLKSGKLGEVYAFDGEYLYGRLEKITEGWRKHVEDYSVMEGGGVHLIDLLLWMTGQRPSRASAMGNNVCTRGTAFRYNDYVAATLECSGGVVARFVGNFGCVHRQQHVLRVFGTKGSFLCDDAGARVHTSRDAQETARAVKEEALPASMGVLIPGFVEAVLKDEDLEAHTQTFFDGIAVCLACDRAAEVGTTVEVEYV